MQEIARLIKISFALTMNKHFGNFVFRVLNLFCHLQFSKRCSKWNLQELLLQNTVRTIFHMPTAFLNGDSPRKQKGTCFMTVRWTTFEAFFIKTFSQTIFRLPLKDHHCSLYHFADFLPLSDFRE